MLEKLEVYLGIGKGSISGDVKYPVNEETELFGRGKYDVKNNKKKGTVGVNIRQLGELGISYEDGKLEPYYKPSRLVKVLGYIAPMFFGLKMGMDVFSTAPEPYKLPAAVASAFITGFAVKKLLDFLFSTSK